MASKNKFKKELPQDFASVAKRLECDPDLAAFDAKLKKIAKAKTSGLRSDKAKRP